MRIEERELILPALYFIDQKPNMTTTELISILTEVFKPTGEDAQILDNRSDTKFSQKVRNLVSHRAGNAMEQYLDYQIRDCLRLSPQGEAYLQRHWNDVEHLSAYMD